jgi:hypothetical protein
MATVTAARTVILPRTQALGVRFDWLAIVASAWLLGGLYWDGWAHGYGLPDSFWTIWHAAFYSGFAACTAVILGGTSRSIWRWWSCALAVAGRCPSSPAW